MSLVFYWTDLLIYLIVLGVIFLIWRIKRNKELQYKILLTFKRSRYLVALIIFTWFALIGLLDSIHFKSSTDFEVKSLLDIIFDPRSSEVEITYSAPFSIYAYNKEIIKKPDGRLEEVYPRLEFAGQHLKDPANKFSDIFQRVLKGLSIGIAITLLVYLLTRQKLSNKIPKEAKKPFWITISLMIILSSTLYALMFNYHVLGTDKIGQDVFYVAMKSIRTGLVIGTVTTLIMLPFALFFGMWAGYFRGIVDDIIQYVYTTLSSIPGVLLIAAAILSLQNKIEQDPELRLLVLCIILGVTSWIGLCRLLRGETLKLREMEFVQSAMTMGVSHFNIIRRHIMPNLLHIVVITMVLEFSGLVLAEAVLTFVGVGVGAQTYSFGNMINASRLEMARDPMVWWSLAGSFILMFVLVFSANIVAEAVQEILNPRNQ